MKDFYWCGKEWVEGGIENCNALEIGYLWVTLNVMFRGRVKADIFHLGIVEEYNRCYKLKYVVNS